MLGVVLWQSAQRHKAVVWCEDQRDLAYFDAACGDNHKDALDTPFEAGDLVQFEIEEMYGRRYVMEPRRLACGPELKDQLLTAAKRFGVGPKEGGADQRTAKTDQGAQVAQTGQVLSFAAGCAQLRPGRKVG